MKRPARILTVSLFMERKKKLHSVNKPPCVMKSSEQPECFCRPTLSVTRKQYLQTEDSKCNQFLITILVADVLFVVWLLCYRWWRIWIVWSYLCGWSVNPSEEIYRLGVTLHLCDVRMTDRPSLMMLRMQSQRKRRALGSIPVVGSSCNKCKLFTLHGRLKTEKAFLNRHEDGKGNTWTDV